MIKYTCEGIENLRDLYFVQHMTIEQISKIVGTSKQNVSKLIHKYFTTEEIQAEKTFRHPTKQPSTYYNDIKEYRDSIQKMYESGLPVQQIADITGRKYDTIIDHLNRIRKSGIEIEKRNPKGGNYR